jgi:hypothetical protein
VPLRNRVTPTGEIIADPARGNVFGNRGCLHDANGEIRRRFASKAWIACRLEFKNRRRPLLQPGRYTELFFLDDATALAAGHRPCAECRRADYKAFLAAAGAARAPELDARLHAERMETPHQRAFGALPDGAFVWHEEAPWLVLGARLRRWTPAGYTDALERPTGSAVVLTPRTSVDVLAGGWRPQAVAFIGGQGV